MFNNIFKISVIIISILILIISIYSSTILSIDYFDSDKTKPKESNSQMKRFHEPSSEIRQGELELEKEFISDEITKEISKIDSMIENLESKNYDSVLEELKIQKTQLESNLNLDLKRIDLEILRNRIESRSD